MCGIAGIVNFDGKVVKRNELDKMNCMLVHRGPDGNGIWQDKCVGLAHSRLAIIDPEFGAQPLCNDSETVIISYNGEVYNYIELREELKAEFDFKTESDTEVVLRSYEKWGIDCLRRFRGMFAFALYNSTKSKLYLVRDRVGIKPLYYYYSPVCAVFCSELLPIISLPYIKRKISHSGLCQYFRYQYIPAPLTIYEDIYKLEPGHYLEIDTITGRRENIKYWDIEAGIAEKTEEKWLDDLNGILDETMRMYVRSDVVFGAFLSGGVDSSLVSALMAKQMKEPVRTFTIGFSEQKHSETPYARKASVFIGSDHYEKIVTPTLAEEMFAKIAQHFGEPFGDSSAIPTYYVSKEAAESVKMVLSGDGGDELFCGYNSYQDTYKNIDEPQERHRQLYNAQRQGFDTTMLKELFANDLPVAEGISFSLKTKTDIDPVLFFQAQDFKTYLPGDVLTKVDRMSMAHSLEVRVPLLDHKIVEQAFTLPLSLRIRNNFLGRIKTKYLLKKSAERFYPSSFIERPKQGFGIPIVEWLRGPLQPIIESHLMDARNPIYEWLNFDYVKAMLDDFTRGASGHAARIWYVFVFSLWRKYVHQG
ncbi:MAG: asparagine synthase (glutamine-hydrolyzing) [Candidatus Omnitrophota bacterium]